MRPDHTGSPAEIFFRRNMRTEVDYERIQVLRQEAVAVRKKKATSKLYRCDFKLGDRVVIQDSRSQRWSERGTIVGERPCVELGSSRSYLVDTGGAQPKLRNRQYIRLSYRTIQPAEQMDWLESSPVGEDQIMERRKPGRRTVRFIDQDG